MHIPGRLWIWWHRAQNRYADARAVLAGYCNHRPWSPRPGEGGGYSHWRCALKRGHEGMHRFRNYVWSDDGHTNYLPIPASLRTPYQPWERNMTPTRRQAREQEAWQQEQVAKRRAARAAAGDH